MRKIVLLGLGVLLVAALSACGGAKSTAPSPADVSASLVTVYKSPT